MLHPSIRPNRIALFHTPHIPFHIFSRYRTSFHLFFFSGFDHRSGQAGMIDRLPQDISRAGKLFEQKRVLAGPGKYLGVDETLIMAFFIKHEWNYKVSQASLKSGETLILVFE
ncbi:MAG: hypothetical protein ACOC0H_07110 [Thermodesulfobacteriota bacterium]